MAYGIGRYQKLKKQDRNILDNATDTYLPPSITSYSRNRSNENTDSKTTIILPPYFYTSIQNQHKSAPDASEGSNDVSPSGLDQSKNYNCNTNRNNNDDSQSHDTPHKNGHS